MTPQKILYVDDEPMALKYFERLVSPLAPVLTAPSVAAGKAALQQHGHEIAVLVSDQRMPGETGNELLRYARDNHPSIVRMLTTAYSELGEAIEAINSGEIYRYITKPWDLESLRADLKNALELAGLRGERDALLREKLMVQQGQLLAARVTQIGVACAGFVRPDYAARYHGYLQAVSAAGCRLPQIDWRVMDHTDLLQAEATRSIAVGAALAEWKRHFGSAVGQPGLAMLAEALGGAAEMQGGQLVVRDRAALLALLEGVTAEPVTPANTAWLGWLLAGDTGAVVTAVDGGWAVALAPLAAQASLPRDWMAAAIEQIERPDDAR